jgi:hypothetical protein
MVQAILAGTKTQTRRLVKSNVNLLQSDFSFKHVTRLGSPTEGHNTFAVFQWNGDPHNKESTLIKCPYGNVGDVLWVRETWRKYYPTDEHGKIDWDRPIIEYAADNPDPIYLSDGDGCIETDAKGNEKLVPFKPSIHMPYDLCRLFLKIISIRVERLQDINLNDARAEGIVETWGDGGRSLFPSDQPHEYDNRTSVENYTKLWGMINGAESWEENPWVWVVEFEKTDKPELQ